MPVLVLVLRALGFGLGLATADVDYIMFKLYMVRILYKPVFYWHVVLLPVVKEFEIG